MASDGSPQEGEGLSPAKRKRLEKIFEHATKRMTTATPTSNDFDYCADLLAQCVSGDPGNDKFLRAYWENLQKKYNNNKKGGRLANFQERGARSALKKALDQEQWNEVFVQGLKVLAVNPWDVPTLTGMARASKKRGYWECEMYYLHCALVANADDPETNRLCAIAAGERGLFDQAIACWHRVEKALPTDEEAKRSISVLTLQRAQSRGDFGGPEAVKKPSGKPSGKPQEPAPEEVPPERKLLQKIEREPKNLAHYLELCQIYFNEERYKDAEQLLAKAYQVSDKDPDIRDRWADTQLRYLRQKIAQAEDPAAKKKLELMLFDKELKFYQRQIERYPSNLAFRYEVGYRYMLTKRYTEAIQELQKAKNDPHRRGMCLLALGRCFERIKQYRLAMNHYEEAIAEIPDRDAVNKKQALYVAGRLAMGLKDIDTAEKHLSTLAGLDFSYRDVSTVLDKIAKLRENPQSGAAGSQQPEAHDGPEADRRDDSQESSAGS
jgi:tetratricopeptide (TPR) repeat protein